MASNCQQGKIYKLLNDIDDDVYVGSTTQPLSKRMVSHRKSAACSKTQSRLYTKMRELGVGHFYIELIEECPCDNIEQLRAVEGKYIREVGTLNQRIECRSDKQYRIDNKEKKKIDDAKYQAANKEKLKAYNKAYYEANKDKLFECQRLKRLENYEAKKDKLNERRRFLRKQAKNKKEKDAKASDTVSSVLTKHDV